MAIPKQKNIAGIDNPYETDPAKIADPSTLGGGLKGLVGAAAGGIGNAVSAFGSGVKNAALATTAYGSNADKPFEAHYERAPDTDQAKAITVPLIATPAAAATIPTSTKTAAAPPIEANLRIGNINPDGSTPQLSRLSDGTIPQPGKPGATALNTSAVAQPSPIGAVADPGTGFAMVGGKKIDYPAIGSKTDPLKAGYDGSGRVAGQTANSLGIADNLIAGQPAGVSQEYKDQVSQAIKFNAANGFAPSAEQIRTTGMSNADQINLLAANNRSGRFSKLIADMQGQQKIDIASQAETADAAYKQGMLAIDKPYKEGLVKADLLKSNGVGELNAAHTNNLNAEAEYKRAIASPEYLGRQERIAQMKDKAAAQKEQDKLDFEVTKNWVKGVVGADPSPQELQTGVAYMKQLDNYKRGFDAFLDKLPATQKAFWLNGLQTKEPSVMKELARRGLVKPAEPVFAPRIAAIGPVTPEA